MEWGKESEGEVKDGRVKTEEMEGWRRKSRTVAGEGRRWVR